MVFNRDGKYSKCPPRIFFGTEPVATTWGKIQASLCVRGHSTFGIALFKARRHALPESRGYWPLVSTCECGQNCITIVSSSSSSSSDVSR